MFKLYTDKRKIPENFELIEFVDAYFDAEVIMEPLSLYDNTELKAIDKSQLDKSMLNVVTPFGAISLYGISTGCKTVLLAKRFQNSNKVINILECGNNALEYILEHYDNVCLYCKREKSLPYTEKQVIVNDKRAYNFAKASSNWGRRK